MFAILKFHLPREVLRVAEFHPSLSRRPFLQQLMRYGSVSSHCLQLRAFQARKFAVFTV